MTSMLVQRRSSVSDNLTVLRKATKKRQAQSPSPVMLLKNATMSMACPRKPTAERQMAQVSWCFN